MNQMETEFGKTKQSKSRLVKRLCKVIKPKAIKRIKNNTNFRAVCNFCSDKMFLLCQKDCQSKERFLENCVLDAYRDEHHLYSIDLCLMN